MVTWHPACNCRAQVIAKFVEDSATGVAPTLQLVSRYRPRQKQGKQRPHPAVQHQQCDDMVPQQPGVDNEDALGGLGAPRSYGSNHGSLGLMNRIQERSIYANQAAGAISFARGVFLHLRCCCC